MVAIMRCLFALLVSCLLCIRDSSGKRYSCQPNLYEDGRCRDYCNEFIRKCVNPGYFEGFGSGGGLEGCLAACAQFPREDYDFTEAVADNIQCRELHLSWEPASYHCPHASPDGGYVCGNIEIDGFSPYQAKRSGACTHRFFGVCQLSGDDKVADCTQSGIDDETLPHALAVLPETVEILFLTKNEGITNLPNAIFSDNLRSPSTLKALFVNGCMIQTVSADTFLGLDNLELLNLDVNAIAELPSGVLFHTPELKEFSIFNNNLEDGTVWGEDGSLLFSQTFHLRRINLFGMQGITSLPQDIFQGLSELESIKLANNGLTNEGVPEGVFDDLTSLRVLDLSLNDFTSINAAWFGRWAEHLEVLSFWWCQLESPLNESMFENLVNLERIYLLENPDLPDFDPEVVFANNKRLRTLAFDL